MTVRWSTVNFSVLSPDGFLPGIEQGDNAELTYSASIMIPSTTEMETLRGDVSTISVQPAMGVRAGGVVTIEAGTGVRHLVIPLPERGEEEWTAILTAFTPTANMLHADAWTAEVSWFLIAKVTT